MNVKLYFSLKLLLLAVAMTFIPTLISAQTQNHISYVDLGLSVKWATCNLGATEPESFGNYYAWGETETKKTYGWASYKYIDTETANCTKYTLADNRHNLESNDDAVATELGGKWRMPTVNEMRELCEYCYWHWTSRNGVYGYDILGPNGNTIFLPAAGHYTDDKLYTLSGSDPTQTQSKYWTASFLDKKTCGMAFDDDKVDNANSKKAVCLNFDVAYDNTVDYNNPSYLAFEGANRSLGCPIRPVFDDKKGSEETGSIPVVILSKNADGVSSTLTFTYADASTATAKDGEEGIYRLNTRKEMPGWNHPGLLYAENNISVVKFDPSFAKARPSSTYMWFAGNPNLKAIEGIKYLNTSEVTDMSYMFYNTGLTNLDVSSFDTKNVKDMTDMFALCSYLQDLDLSSFNTSNVHSFRDMFDGCSRLNRLDISNFNTSNALDLGGMFNSIWTDNIIGTEKFDTRKAKFMSSMYGDTKMTALDFSGYYFGNVLDASGLLSGAASVTSLNMGSNDLKNVPTIDKYDNTDAFNGVGTVDKPCKLIINQYFDKSVLGEKLGTESQAYYKWHDGYFSEPVLTGIDVFREDNPNSSTTYNISGQKVEEKYKGIVIAKGRKYIRK